MEVQVSGIGSHVVQPFQRLLLHLNLLSELYLSCESQRRGLVNSCPDCLQQGHQQQSRYHIGDDADADINPNELSVQSHER